MKRSWVLAGVTMIASAANAQAPGVDPAVEDLNRALLGAETATGVLQSWCDARYGAGKFRIHAAVDRVADAPASAEQRARLQVSAAEPLGYRSVALMCGDLVLSRAENWYVPARLTAEMNAALAGDTPFGAVIRPLAPNRHTFSSDFAWPGQGEDDVLRHRAVVHAGEGLPIAEVVETYQRVMLAR